MTTRAAHRAGFTLIELLLAAMITALIAGATAIALGQMARARSGSASREQAFSRAEAAASRIAHDLITAARDEDLTFARVAIADGGNPGAAADQLLLLTRSLRRVRGLYESPEGADFEVQYRLDLGTAGLALWRRADPALDDFPDAGGVAAPIAEGVSSLSLEASDGVNWYSEWDSDTDGLPYGVRVVVSARADRGATAVTFRRIVALDRVPPPPAPADEDDAVPDLDSSSTASGGGGR